MDSFTLLCLWELQISTCFYMRDLAYPLQGYVTTKAKPSSMNSIYSCLSEKLQIRASDELAAG